EKFIDGSADGKVFFLGMLADASTNTSWACEIWPKPEKKTVSALRAYDLTSGAAKFRWDLPGDNNLCNDMTLAPDKSLYVSDTPTGRIWRLKPGAAEGELVLEDMAKLNGIDGLTFLDGVLYVNNVISNGIYRVPLDAGGKAGALVEIKPDDTVTGPDGM